VLTVSKNNLRSLPVAVHDFSKLLLRTDGNHPKFALPPKPPKPQHPLTEIYYADFSRISPIIEPPRRSLKEVLGLPTTPVRIMSPQKVRT
jgi:hypothetical protein